MVPVPVLEQGKGRAFVHVCGCVLGPVCLYVHVCILVYEQVSRDSVWIVVRGDLSY